MRFVAFVLLRHVSRLGSAGCSCSRRVPKAPAKGQITARVVRPFHRTSHSNSEFRLK